MQQLTRDEKDTALLHFADAAEDNRIILRRTQLEQSMFCPYMARQIELGNVHDGSQITEVGEAVHQAHAAAITAYIENDGQHDSRGLADELRLNLRESRPDLQPKVLDAARAATWSWSKYVAGLHPGCIIAFDGGDRLKHPDDPDLTRSGQLSHEIPFGSDTVVVTAELDLLHSTASPDVLCEVDYKSGFRPYDYATIAAEFQFSTHAWLVFQNFPSVEWLDVRIWSTRFNGLTPRMRFSRVNLADYHGRVLTAVTEYMRHKDNPNPPATPFAEKCDLCPCALTCPHSHSEIPSDAVAGLERLIVLEAALSTQKKALWKHVESTGADIVTLKGDAFGNDKPRQTRKPENPLYQLKEIADATKHQD